jgi:hypothetical protein
MAPSWPPGKPATRKGDEHRHGNNSADIKAQQVESEGIDDSRRALGLAAAFQSRGNVLSGWAIAIDLLGPRP